MNITLSNEHTALAERQATQAGYSDLSAYLEHLIDEADSRQVDRQEALSAIREGLEDIKAGRTLPMSEVMTQIGRKHDIQVPNGK